MRALRCNRPPVTRCFTTCPTTPRGCHARQSLSRCPGVKPFPGTEEPLQRARFSALGKLPTKVAEPTIYALSTAPGRAAIAIVRVSGLACVHIYRALCPKKRLPSPRYASVRSIYEPSAGSKLSKPALLDSQALVLYFPAPTTATGEDILELHLHGGHAVVKAVLNAIGKCSTTALPIRYADPGEFTRRAFLNDRLDLTQVEALGETLSAVTEEQRRISVQGTGGGLAARYESWRHLLLYARGELEALIDFAEDQHFDESPASLAASVAIQIRSLEKRIAYYRANAMRGELLRNGISISIIGAPNVGKSSLLNLIVGRNAAIVSKEAGTTRDVVEVGIDLGGYFCRLGDTAGLRHSTSPTDRDSSLVTTTIVGEIEKEGIRRAKEKASRSDVVIVVFSVEPAIEDQGAQLSLDPEVLTTATQLLDAGKTVVIVVNKLDNYNPRADKGLITANLIHAIRTVLPAVDKSRIFCVSCEEAAYAHDDGSPPNPGSTSATAKEDLGNLQAFLSGLTITFRDLTAPLMPEAKSDSELATAPAPTGINETDTDMAGTFDPSTWHESLGTTQRQRALLEECSAHLRAFLEQVDTSAGAKMKTGVVQEGGDDDDHDDDNDRDHEIDVEFDIVAAAEILRAAAECLGKISGRGSTGDVEEVLGVVFEKFCVGK